MAKKVKNSDFIATGQVVVNRRATFDYAIEETFVAGIELKGTEVKSLRLGKASLTDTYGSYKIIGAMAKKGYSLIAKRVFFDDHGRAKIEVGLGKGKKLYDKRESIKKRDIERKLKEF